MTGFQLPGGNLNRLYSTLVIFFFVGYSSAQDIIYHSLCTGVNIHEPWKFSVESLFIGCLSKGDVDENFSVGQKQKSRSFLVTTLNRQLKEKPNPTNELTIGVRDFAKAIWDQEPYKLMNTPFASVSTRFNTVMFNAQAVKHVYLKSRHPRMKAYQAKVRDEALYVAGRTVVSEHFTIEWGENPSNNHISAIFKQEAAKLDESDYSLDQFIKNFGTHYRRSVTFGGQFGADYYFDSFGTPRDLQNALQHVQHADMMAAQNETYEVPFVGFSRKPVTHFAWSQGGDPKVLRQLGVKTWWTTVRGNLAILDTELRPVTELLEAVGIPNVYVLMDKLEDRIAKKAIQLAHEAYSCFWNRSCKRDELCMGNQCVKRPMAPKWPENGRFCIPKPSGGRCPSPDEYNEFTDHTWVHWDTENGEPDQPYVGADHITSQGLDPEQVHAMINSEFGGGIKMFYCCLRAPKTKSWERESWPSGTYCLYSSPAWSVLTDRKWSFDSILWNDEDTDNRNNWKTAPHFGGVPFGHYRKSYTEQKLQCRNDGPHSNPIILPKQYPFYLIRNGDTCQEVWGMQWTHVQVTWDTENNIELTKQLEDPNAWVRYNMWIRIKRNCIETCVDDCEKSRDRELCVRLTQDKIVMDFCYYEELKTPSPTPMPTPAPTPPTLAPTTDAPTPGPPTPTPPPTPPPPTKRPTPGPTRPTPSPIFPTPPPTRSPTLAPPTPSPTRKPTPAPTPPTPAPTKRPTPSPTPAPTNCPWCPQLSGVNIVGLHSKWPGDLQPEKQIFSLIPCDCKFCSDEKACVVKENCRIRYHMGDIMLLRKFWLDRPIELEADDLLFLRLTWDPNSAPRNGPRNNFFRDLTGDELRRDIFMDLQHARNALLYGGSYRMQDYGKAYSIMKRHIASEYEDAVLMATHWVARANVKHIVFVERSRLPVQSDLTFEFQTDADELSKALNGERKGNRKKDDVDAMFDKFIHGYGTHYIWSVSLGGEYGADWFWSGYGTKPEMTLAMRDIKNADLAEVFERNRFKTFEDPLNGASFIRLEGGKFWYDNDVKGFINGGDPYGIRGGRGHEEWAKHLDLGEDLAILHYRKLVSNGKLLQIIARPSYISSNEFNMHRDLLLERFKTRVYFKAHYWLVLHYWCFIMDNSCENQRRHPFLREAILGQCGSELVSRKHLRSRTELETCLGQASADDGYMLKSKHFPFKAVKWCKGDNIVGHPSNYPPYTLTRKSNCPLVPPLPRWANAHSWCLPKPVSKTVLACPKEHYPEYEWNWDWQDWIRTHHWYVGQFAKVTRNLIFAGPANINPTNEVWSPYPWIYGVHDYTPRTTVFNMSSNLGLASDLSLKTLRDELIKYKGDSLPNHNGSCYFGLCTYPLGYLEMPLYPSNRVYIRDQCPFLQEIGWMFWDTEDSTDDRPVKDMQVAIKPTPTHMPVAEHWPLKDNWDVVCMPGVPREVCKPQKFTKDERRVGGRKTVHTVSSEHSRRYKLWDPPNLREFYTGGTRIEFCCTTISENQEEKSWHNLHWPNGHLCIYAHGAIDSTIYEFRQGSIGWDCENGAIQDPKKYGNKIYSDSANDLFADWDDVATQQRLTHSLPTGLYHIQYDGLSEQFFSQNVLCMDVIPDKDHSVELPRDVPFYLMRKASTCQKVRGMFHTEVSLTWWTEIDHISPWVETPTYENAFIPLEMNSWGRAQAYGRRDQIPDGYYGQDKIQIWYCFYQPNVIYDATDVDDYGLERTFYLDVASIPESDEDEEWITWHKKNIQPLLLQNRSGWNDLLIMDKKGTYNIRWPNKPTTFCPRI